MPSIPLPENPSLEHLKSQAKFVQELIRTSDDGALSMIDEFHPRLNVGDLDEATRTGFKLSDAQLMVARLYRFASWPKLVDHLKVINEFSHNPAAELDGHDEANEPFVSLACLNYAQQGSNPFARVAQAHRMLEADPNLAGGSIEAVATVGDHQTLAELLDRTSGAVNQPCGPNEWPPLLYATYSRIVTDDPAWSSVETVKVLLDRGADPNAGFLWRGLVPPFTALTGAFGRGESGQPSHADHEAIARLLLEAGADPNDGQTLYNNGIGGQNHDDPFHLELLLEFGLGTDQGGPWYRRLGEQLRDPQEMLYDELEAAALRGRPKHMALLIGLGLDLNRPVGRSQKTPVRLAAQNGHREVLRLLAEAGVDATLEPVEQFLDAVRSAKIDRLDRLMAEDPDLVATLQDDHPDVIKSVSANGAEILRTLMEAGFDINAKTGGSGTTALHHAAQGNDVPLARLLVEHGADPNISDDYANSTPWGWANHFEQPDTAAYLHPLTIHEGAASVIIHSGGAEQTVTTLDELDAALDAIEKTVTEPVLVGLKSQGVNLTIGLGRNDVSVALYLGPDGQPIHAFGQTIDGPDDLAFWKDGSRYEFEPDGALPVEVGREIARRFAKNPSEPPSVVSWRPEGRL